MPADQQYEWLAQRGLPTSEMWGQLDDAVPAWLPFLREHVAVSGELEGSLISLLEFLDSTRGPAWGDELEALQRPEWDEIRTRARQVLALFEG
ncbi:MAG: hypothetical protein ACJ72O_02470 [Marmoricola sp.]